MRSILLAALTFCTSAAAADLEAMQSAECSNALARLQAQGEQQRRDGTVDDATRLRWQGLRTEAARRCLGGDGPVPLSFR